MATSYLSKILIIFIPKAPYDDVRLRIIYQLLVDSFEGLKDVTYSHFYRRIAILEIFVKTRMGCILIYLDMDDLVYKIFHYFIASAREEHANNIIKSMRDIMILIINESDKIHQPLETMLGDIWRKYLVASPIAHILVNSVVKSYKKELRPFMDNKGAEK